MRTYVHTRRPFRCNEAGALVNEQCAPLPLKLGLQEVYHNLTVRTSWVKSSLVPIFSRDQFMGKCLLQHEILKVFRFKKKKSMSLSLSLSSCETETDCWIYFHNMESSLHKEMREIRQGKT